MNTTAKSIAFRAQKINSWDWLVALLMWLLRLQVCPICDGQWQDACFFPGGFQVRRVCPGYGNHGLVRVKR